MMQSILPKLLVILECGSYKHCVVPISHDAGFL